MNWQAYYVDLTSGRHTGIGHRMLLYFLRLLAFGYSLLMKLRASAYRRGLIRSYRLPRPVISVGNIVMGGTGKTPLTACIAAYLIDRGKTVAVLTRGYGGSLEGRVAVVADGQKRLLSPQEAGDEPCLLADRLPGLIVVMGSDRYSAGMLAMERFNPDLFILDDGFQHLRLHRDLDILLLDATKPLGNGYTVPAGTLREPASALKRAGVVVYTRCADGMEPVSPAPADVPAVCSAHSLAGFRQACSGGVRDFDELSGLQGLAFAGIADPDAFFTSLEKAGLKLTATLAFPDHTGYGEQEIAALAALRRKAKADYLITTAKDAVKLTGLSNNESLYIAELQLTFRDFLPLGRELDRYAG